MVMMTIGSSDRFSSIQNSNARKNLQRCRGWNHNEMWPCLPNEMHCARYIHLEWKFVVTFGLTVIRIPIVWMWFVSCCSSFCFGSICELGCVSCRNRCCLVRSIPETIRQVAMTRELLPHTIRWDIPRIRRERVVSSIYVALWRKRPRFWMRHFCWIGTICGFGSKRRGVSRGFPNRPASIQLLHGMGKMMNCMWYRFIHDTYQNRTTIQWRGLSLRRFGSGWWFLLLCCMSLEWKRTNKIGKIGIIWKVFQMQQHNLQHLPLSRGNHKILFLRVETWAVCPLLAWTAPFFRKFYRGFCCFGCSRCSLGNCCTAFLLIASSTCLGWRHW